MYSLYLLIRELIRMEKLIAHRGNVLHNTIVHTYQKRHIIIQALRNPMVESVVKAETDRFIGEYHAQIID